MKKPLFCACSPHKVLLPSSASTFRGRLTSSSPHTPLHPSSTITTPPDMASKRPIFAPSYPLSPPAPQALPSSPFSTPCASPTSPLVPQTPGDAGLLGSCHLYPVLMLGHKSTLLFIARAVLYQGFSGKSGKRGAERREEREGEEKGIVGDEGWKHKS